MCDFNMDHDVAEGNCSWVKEVGAQAVTYQIARVWGSQSCEVRLDPCKEPPTCQPETHLRTPLYLTGFEFGSVTFGMQLELNELPIPIIHHIHKISI
jgi:hypothetical protein